MLSFRYRKTDLTFGHFVYASANDQLTMYAYMYMLANKCDEEQLCDNVLECNNVNCRLQHYTKYEKKNDCIVLNKTIINPIQLRVMMAKMIVTYNNANKSYGARDLIARVNTKNVSEHVLCVAIHPRTNRAVVVALNNFKVAILESGHTMEISKFGQAKCNNMHCTNPICTFAHDNVESLLLSNEVKMRNITIKKLACVIVQPQYIPKLKERNKLDEMKREREVPAKETNETTMSSAHVELNTSSSSTAQTIVDDDEDVVASMIGKHHLSMKINEHESMHDIAKKYM